MIEVDLLRGEIHRIKARIAKCERRITCGKAPVVNAETEVDRQSRLSHILGKKELRLRLLVEGKEV